MDLFRESMDTFSQWIVPVVMLTIVIWGAVKRIDMYESFIKGAKEGFDVAIMIIPYLVAILFVIKVFMASGIFADIRDVAVMGMERVGLGRYTEVFELLPLALTRPLTGGGAQGVLNQIFIDHGPDTFLGMTASLMQGSTETTFYVMTLYFGAIQIKKFRHTLPACLIADAAGLIAAIVIGFMLYGNS